MSDLCGNHIVGFPTRWLIFQPLEELFSLKLEEARQKIAKESELKRQQKDQERVLSQHDESEGDADMVRTVDWFDLIA